MDNFLRQERPAVYIVRLGGRDGLVRADGDEMSEVEEEGEGERGGERGGGS